MRDSVQVIIPALDEEATIGGVVATLHELGLTRVRVVDNGSGDRTAEVAAAAGAEVIAEPRRGYGQACWTGYRQLDEAVEWVLFCDADGSDDLHDIARLLDAAEGGADFVLGNRRSERLAPGAMTPVQHFGNGLATTLIRWGWGQRYHDLGPLRLIRRDLLERIAMRDRGFGWTIEMQVRAVEEGARIVELPVGYRRRGGGRSKISGTIKGSVAAGSIILGTLGELWSQREGHAHYRWGGMVVLLGALAMTGQGDFAVAGTVPWFLAAAALMGVGWLWAGRPREMSMAWFWVVAVLARLVLLPMTPGDDVWRYVWEGQIQQAGFSPYVHAPDASELEALRTPTWALINHPEATAIYPPLAQLLLRAVAAVAGGVLGLKLVFIAADLAVAGLLARRWGRGAALLYAWNPLVLYVGAGGAHYEPVLLLAMVLAWLAWLSGRADARSGLWWGVSVGLKWITAPLLAWCAWARLRAGQWRETVTLSVAGALPVVGGVAWFAFAYGQLGSLAPGDFVASARTAELGPWLLEQVWPGSAYRNGVLLWFFAPLAAWVFFRAATLERFAEGFLLALLVMAPSVHAWYFVWLVPWAVATRNVGTIAVSLSGMIYFLHWRHLTEGDGWLQTPLEKLALWFPLLLGWAWSRWRARLS